MTDEDRSTDPKEPVYEHEKLAELGRRYGIPSPYYNEPRNRPALEPPALDSGSGGPSRPAEASVAHEQKSEERCLPSTVVPPKPWQDRYRAPPHILTLDTSMGEDQSPHRPSLDSVHANHFPRVGDRPLETRRTQESVSRWISYKKPRVLLG